MRSIALLWLATASGLAAEETPNPGPTEPLVLRLVHPDRQTAAILWLFEGTAAPHPAAALAAWKRASREPGRLGKPAEAVISFFNPEMIREWQSFHDARLQLGFGPGGKGVRWRMTVPHDEGLLSALITTMRLSGERRSLPLNTGETAVEPLGPGDAVAIRAESGVILASSRVELDRALQAGANADRSDWLDALDSGLAFRLVPRRLVTPVASTVPVRRLIELVRGLGCERIEGRLALVDDRLGVELSSVLDAASVTRPAEQCSAIDEAWLTWIPEGLAAAAVSIATGPAPADWDRLFALADRVDRADPSRAQLAPLRVRINLLAAASGARLEADLWPHLRGLTCGVLVDPARPGMPGTLLLCLHLDREVSARRILDETLPRLAALGEGRRPTTPGPGPPAPAMEPFRPRRLGRLAGRPLEALARGSTVVIGWGEGALATSLQAADRPETSVRRWLLSGHPQPGRPRPDRVGLLWPGRLSLPMAGMDGSTPVARVLAEGSPIIWSGWSAGEHAHDRVQWGELRELIVRLLATIPLEPRQMR
jgi:hypothetical protein